MAEQPVYYIAEQTEPVVNPEWRDQTARSLAEFVLGDRSYYGDNWYGAISTFCADLGIELPPDDYISAGGEWYGYLNDVEPSVNPEWRGQTARSIAEHVFGNKSYYGNNWYDAIQVFCADLSVELPSIEFIAAGAEWYGNSFGGGEAEYGFEIGTPTVQLA